MRTLRQGKYNLKADILHIEGSETVDPIDDDLGTWENQQDPISWEIVKVWVPATPTDDPTTPNIEMRTVPCSVRGVIGAGVRATGIGENFDEQYQNIEFARLWFPPNVRITKSDRISNVRNRKNQIYWLDEEHDVPQATVFNVLGVTPLQDSYGQLVEWLALLERAEI